MAESSDSSAGVHCILCNTEDENKTTGPLLSKEEISAHQNCLLYSSGIYCKHSPSFDDLAGFEVEDVKNEYNRGLKLKCYRCKKKGATVGCENKKCKRSYHYPCAIADNAKRVKKKSAGLFMLYCPNHDPGHSKMSCPNSSAKKRLNDSRGETSSGSDSVGTPSRLRNKKRKRDIINSDSEESSDIQMIPPIDFQDEEEIVPQEQQGSDSVGTPSRLLNKKRKHDVIDSDSESSDIQMIPPIDFQDEEEIVPQEQHRQSTPVSTNKRNRNTEEPLPCPSEVSSQSPEGDETDIDELQICNEQAPTESLFESEYRNENVLFTVISDSGPFSIDSENSIGTTSPSLLLGTATSAPIDNPHETLSAPKKTATVHTPTVTTPVINPPEPDCYSIDSPPVSGASAAEPVESPNLTSPTKPTCGESDHVKQFEQPDRLASRNIPPLHLSHDLPEPATPPKVSPLDLTASQGCSTASAKTTEDIEKARVSENAASLFWGRCNEVGCTASIFSELTNQIRSLAERVQSQNASQKDYAVSLRILEASGKVPEIFQQLDQDFEEHERELKRKRKALNKARALLNHPN